MARKAKKPTETEEAAPTAAPEETIATFKGFDKDFQCRGFQYEVGKTYEHSGKVEVCASGFHGCEHPLDVFNYYAPAHSRFAEATQSSQVGRHEADTKVVSAKIKIECEISFSLMIERAVKWVFDRAKPEEGGHATGDSGAASATGDSGAASATGDSGAASATGTRGAASATGDSGAASATGDSGAASATGDSGAASATGDSGAAMSSGRWGRAQGVDGCALFLVHRDDEWKITHAWAGIVGQNGIKPLIWYMLDENGNPVEAA